MCDVLFGFLAAVVVAGILLVSPLHAQGTSLSDGSDDWPVSQYIVTTLLVSLPIFIVGRSSKRG